MVSAARLKVYPRYFFGSAVEGCDVPLLVNRKNAIGDAFQNGFVGLIALLLILFLHIIEILN